MGAMWLVVMLWLVSACGWATAEGVGCAEARLKCAYRTGCGAALNNYISWCSDVLRGEPGCPEPCMHALIALTSTDEGKKLMDCECTDDYCQATKQRVEVCRPQVLRASQNETVSCRVSQLICAADALCSTALEYYRRFCRSMFHGKKCSHRCLNSINILRRQEKAAKLATCQCDGLEDYDCPRVQANMARLCFHNYKPRLDVPNEGQGSSISQTSSTSTTTESHDIRTNEINSANTVKFTNVKLIVFIMTILYTSFSLTPG